MPPSNTRTAHRALQSCEASSIDSFGVPLHRRRSGSASPQSARASPTSSAPRRATRGARSARRSSPRARCASPRRARSSPRSSANLIVSSCSRGSCSRSSAGTRWVIPTRSTTSSATSLTRSSSATVPSSWNLLRARRSWRLRMFTKNTDESAGVGTVPPASAAGGWPCGTCSKAKKRAVCRVHSSRTVSRNPTRIQHL